MALRWVSLGGTVGLVGSLLRVENHLVPLSLPLLKPSIIVHEE